MTKFPVECVIFDVDGVLDIDYRAPVGAPELLSALAATLPIIMFTNETRFDRITRASMLNSSGYNVKPEQIYSTPYLTNRFISAHNYAQLLVLSSGTGANEVRAATLVPDGKAAVVIGDYFDSFDKSTVQRAFDLLNDGSDLIAMNDKRWFRDGKRKIPDVGFWVAAFSYCSERPPILIGKPAAYGYEMILRDLEVAPERALMIADEVFPDLAGARQIGIRTALLGESAQSGVAASLIDYRVGSFDALRQLLTCCHVPGL